MHQFCLKFDSAVAVKFDRMVGSVYAWIRPFIWLLNHATSSCCLDPLDNFVPGIWSLMWGLSWRISCFWISYLPSPTMRWIYFSVFELAFYRQLLTIVLQFCLCFLVSNTINVLKKGLVLLIFFKHEVWLNWSSSAFWSQNWFQRVGGCWFVQIFHFQSLSLNLSIGNPALKIV